MTALSRTNPVVAIAVIREDGTMVGFDVLNVDMVVSGPPELLFGQGRLLYQSQYGQYGTLRIEANVLFGVVGQAEIEERIKNAISKESSD